MNSVDKKQITVTMSMEQYEYYERVDQWSDKIADILERAVNKDGIAVMTDELKETIEELSLY